jgi:hypothetical protein
MATSASPQSLQSLRETSSTRPVDFRFPLDLFTASLCVLGALDFLRYILPSHPRGAELAAIAVLGFWRFGMHKTGILPWNTRRERDGAFSWRQGLAEGSSFFIFMLALAAFGGTAMRLSAVILAATVGLLYGVYGGWYSSAEPLCGGVMLRGSLPETKLS